MTQLIIIYFKISPHCNLVVFPTDIYYIRAMALRSVNSTRSTITDNTSYTYSV